MSKIDGKPLIHKYSEFDRIDLVQGRNDFQYEDCCIETYIQNIELTGYLFVLLSGARDPNKHPLPKFDRWKWASEFPGVTVCISDPTLRLHDEKLRIGWYFGTSKCNYASRIASLVGLIASKLDIEQEKVLFYGSSAGGFGALSISSNLPGSTAVAINPQVLLENYISWVYEKFFLYAVGDKKDITDEIERRMDARKFVGINPKQKVLLMQNILDIEHYEHHFIPFCKALNVVPSPGLTKSGNIWTYVYSDESGHGPEPRSLFPEILGYAIELVGE